jgi:hypothetical protein
MIKFTNLYTCKQKRTQLYTKKYTGTQISTHVANKGCVQLLYTTIQKCVQINSLSFAIIDRKVGLTGDGKLYTLRVRVEMF